METQIKFGTDGIKVNGVYHSVWYSEGSLLTHPEGTITIYAQEYGSVFPIELNPRNDTDSQMDYFDKDHARITPDNKFYPEVKQAMEKQKAKRDMLQKKREAKRSEQ